MLRGIRETVARALHGRSSETVIENETASSLFAQHPVPYNRRSSRSVAVHFHRFAPRNAAVNTLRTPVVAVLVGMFQKIRILLHPGSENKTQSPRVVINKIGVVIAVSAFQHLSSPQIRENLRGNAVLIGCQHPSERTFAPHTPRSELSRGIHPIPFHGCGSAVHRIIRQLRLSREVSARIAHRRNPSERIAPRKRERHTVSLMRRNGKRLYPLGRKKIETRQSRSREPFGGSPSRERLPGQYSRHISAGRKSVGKQQSFSSDAVEILHGSNTLLSLRVKKNPLPYPIAREVLRCRRKKRKQGNNQGKDETQVHEKAKVCVKEKRSPAMFYSYIIRYSLQAALPS